MVQAAFSACRISASILQFIRPEIHMAFYDKSGGESVCFFMRYCPG